MATPVRFAIVGFGHHAVKRLLPAFAASKQVTLTGMWRRNQATAADNCRDYGIAHCFPTAEALCSSPEVDAVFITSPDAMHRDDTLLALHHGKAVLCEKPLAMNAGEAEAMERAATEAVLLLGVAQNFRYNRSLDLIREQIAGGRIGEPQLAHAQFAYPAGSAPRTWIKDPTLATGGPVADVGVHCIDSLRYVLDADVRSVSTLANTEGPGARVESVATLQLELTGGVLATVSVSARAAYRALVEVVGSEGTLIAEDGLTVDRPVRVDLRREGEVIETTIVDNHEGYTLMLDAFAEAMHGGKAFRATAADGVHNMRVLDAAYKSWDSGRRETV